MNFKTAVWIDPATEHYCARIYPELELHNLQAWGLSAADEEPIDVTASSVRALGIACEEALERISPGFPMSKFDPQMLGRQSRGADIRALLEAKLTRMEA